MKIVEGNTLHPKLNFADKPKRNKYTQTYKQLKYIFHKKKK